MADMTRRKLTNTLDDELTRRQLRRDYGSYVMWVNEGYYMTTMHRYICDKVQEFLTTPTNKALDILLLSVPPQHGKSRTLTETLPAWYLGKNPTKSVITAGYEGTFAEGFNRRNRDKFNMYNGDIFGVSPNKNVQGVALWETDKGGRSRAAGLKGGITGHPADLFIIDDPVKNREAADSEAIIAKIHDEMVPSVQSRIHPGGKLIVIQTRWVENDVIGYCLKYWKDFVWQYINLPCECDDPENDPLNRQLGDSLMGPHLGDYHLPDEIRNDNDWLVSKKALILAGEGERMWNALYQGRPSAVQGNLFQRGWWRQYSRANIADTDFEFMVMSVDAAFKKTETSDMVCIQIWGLRQNGIYLYKLINRRMGFVETVKYIRQLYREHPTIDQVLIEDKANGSAILDTLRYDEANIPLVGVNPVGGKYSRASAVSPFVSQGSVFLPNDFTAAEARDIEWPGPEQYTPLQMFIEQCATFPFASNDDMVDAMSQALTRMIKLIVGEEAMPQRKYLRFVKWYPDMWEDYDKMSPSEQIHFIQTYGAPLEWKELA